jgi:catechol 2,3-dioxygenase-like lactoylglutathione lyase family enzyme
MLTDHPIIAFVATKSPERARDFYENVLGLKLVADEQWAIVFDAKGTMLRIQKVQDLRPQPFTALGFRVPDIASAVRELAGKGVEFVRYEFLPQDALGIWDAPGGGRVAWFRDPDGNLLSLTQFGRAL